MTNPVNNQFSNQMTTPPQPQPTSPPQYTRHRRFIGWWQALLFMLAGSLLTILFALLFIVFFVGAPQTTTPMALPTASGKLDLTAQVSQEYVNREISSILAKKPVNILGVADVKGVVVQFNPDSSLAATVRIAAFGRQLDINLKETVHVENNQVALTLKEDPKLGLFGIPVGVLDGVLAQVNANVASQLNTLITSVAQAKDCTTGQQIGRVPTLQGIDVQQGVLNAQFTIAITT